MIRTVGPLLLFGLVLLLHTSPTHSLRLRPHGAPHKHCSIPISLPRGVRQALAAADSDVDDNDTDSLSPAAAATKSTIKLPIVQVVSSGELVGEFVMGGDMAGSLQMLKAKVAMLRTRAYMHTNEERGSCAVDNVYSDAHLGDIVSRPEGLAVIKFYREGCRKCAALDPLFDDMAACADNPSRLRFLRVDVANIPDYVSALRARLQGKLAADA